MKKILPFLILFLCSQAQAALWIKPFDKIGVKNISRDLTDSTGTCSSGQVIKYNGSIFQCQADATSAGGGSVDVSEDGTFVISADTINFTTGIKATSGAAGKATVSSDMATTTTPGIASFDSTQFTVGPFGGVSIGTVPVADGGTGLTSISDDAVLVGNNAGNGFDAPALPNCTDTGGQHLNYTAATNNFSCGTTGDGAGSGGGFSIRVSEDGTFVQDNETRDISVNFTTGLKATAAASGDVVVVSGDIATTTTPGIASFDSSTFTVRADGGVQTVAFTGDVTTAAGSFATTIADNAVDGTDIALGSDTAGDIMYYNGTDWVRLPIGSAGQVLEVNAGATAPEWDTDDTGGAGGGTVAVSEDGAFVVSADTVNFTSGIEATTSASGKATVSIDLLRVSADGLSSTTANPSGLEIVNSKLSLLQGCSNGFVLRFVESIDAWQCASVDTVTASATPSVDFYDSDATDGDINIQILGNCSDASSNSEDCDIRINQQKDGVLIPRVSIDAQGVVGLRGGVRLGDLGSNYTSFDALGVETYAGSAKPRKRIFFSPTAGTPTTTGGAADAAKYQTSANLINTYWVSFDASTVEKWQTTFTLPENYDGGTFTAAVEWTGLNDPTNNGVVWGVKGMCVDNDDPIDTAFGSAVTVTDTTIASYDLHRTAETSAITFGGTPAGGDRCWLEVSRDAVAAGDTVSTDVNFMGAWITYAVDARSTED